MVVNSSPCPRPGFLTPSKLNEAAVYHEPGGSRWPGMSYQEGAETGIRM